MTPFRPKTKGKTPVMPKGNPQQKAVNAEKKVMQVKDRMAAMKDKAPVMSAPVGGKAPSAKDMAAKKASMVKKPVVGKVAPKPAMPGMKKGGMCGAKKYARGGGIEVKGKTKGKLI